MGAYMIGEEKQAWEKFYQVTGLSDLSQCLILKPEDGKTYKVEELSQVYAYIRESSPFQRYCVITHAEGLSVVVQNKLLKAMEDSDTEFYLFATEDSLLPTVRSRLRGYRLEREEDIFPYFQVTHRKELIEKVPVMEKGYQLPMSISSFFVRAERTLMDSFIHEGALSKVWTRQERLLICGRCEEYLKKGAVLTKDDLFVFLVYAAQENIT